MFDRAQFYENAPPDQLAKQHVARCKQHADNEERDERERSRPSAPEQHKAGRVRARRLE